MRAVNHSEKGVSHAEGDEDDDAQACDEAHDAQEEGGVTQEHIATRAYYIHLEEGGDPYANWLRAERELVPA